MKKIIGILALLLSVVVATLYFSNDSRAEQQNSLDQVEVETETTDYLSNFDQQDSYGVAQKVKPLTQTEYDDLISSLPEGASLSGDVEVMPGVVK